MTLPINPKIITWARDRNGLSVDALARKMGKDPTDIANWEAGTKTPSYSCLEDLAYKYLKIPLAVFFFPEPPDIDDPVKKFRRLPDYEQERLSPDTLQAIRRTQGYQDSLAELITIGTSSRNILNDITPKRVDISLTAQQVRKYLDLTLEKQFAFKSNEQAFKGWRYALENAGVFTFKDSLEDRFISGFCLFHPQLPVIMINNSTAFARQIFTLAHELGHILFGIDGITDVDEAYIRFLSPRDRALEIKCNQFAAELLVPGEAINKDFPIFKAIGFDSIQVLADKYCVSREVILRRFLDHGLVTSDTYEEKSREWNRDYLRQHTVKPGGNYYLTRLAYLGEGFTRLAFENYHRGRLSKNQLATHLNVNSRNIDKLERYVGY